MWLLAARPATLPAAVVPVLVGTAAALHGGVQLQVGPFVAALVAALLIQIGTNFANDVFDFRKGADTAERLGPPRVTQSGMVPPEQVLIATFVTFGLAALVGVYLVLVGGWPILVVGVLSILAGLAYTGGPWPIGYHSLGDLFVFIFFGVVAVVGSAYLQTLSITPLAVWASFPVGLLVTAILVVNNLRDIDTDRQVGKKTLAVRLGRRAHTHAVRKLRAPRVRRAAGPVASGARRALVLDAIAEHATGYPAHPLRGAERRARAQRGAQAHGTSAPGIWCAFCHQPVAALITPDWLRQRADLAPDRVALIGPDDQTWSFRDFHRRVDAAAALLLDQHARPGDRIGLLAPNSLAYAVAVQALMRIGAVLVPINTRLTPA